MPAFLAANWHYPTEILVGNGRVRDLPALCQAHDIYRPLIVTDKGLAQADFISDIQSMLSSSKIYADIKSNPNGDNINSGVRAYHAGGHDGIIAIGGGSGLDAGKAIALMVGQSRPIWDFEDVADNWQRVDERGMVPVIAIPTTAGTGSEVGRAAVIVDESCQQKKIIFHPRMLPAIVILDPELTQGLPAHLTAATGMDAFVHSFEAFCSPCFHPMADGIALQGMVLVKQWLPMAYADGSNLEARGQLLAASSMGATAFQKGLGAVHALAHPLGARYDKHHGLLNAILLPYVVVANRSAIKENLSQICGQLALKGNESEGAFSTFLAWLLRFRSLLNIPHTLAEIDLNTDESRLIAEQAVLDPAAASNPRVLSVDDYQQIYCNAVSGVIE